MAHKHGKKRKAHISGTDTQVYGVIDAIDHADVCVYEKPDMDSAVTAVLHDTDKVLLYPHGSDDEWYCICTAIGVEGFCPRKHVTVKH